MTQNETILKHLRKEGSHITRLEAMFLYGIQNITARITELREDHQIDTNMHVDAKGHEYARYSLAA